MTATRRTRFRITGLQAGVVMAIAAVAAGAFFQVRPPEAYGICMACHGRDLVNWVGREITGNARLVVAPAAVVFPLLTVVGVILGARFAEELGFRRDAEKRYADARREAQAESNRLVEAEALEGLARSQRDHGQARTSYKNALEIWTALGDAAGADRVRKALASLQ